MRGDRYGHRRLIGHVDPHHVDPHHIVAVRVPTSWRIAGHDRTWGQHPEMPAAHRIGDGHQPGSVTEDRLHLNLGDDVGHTGQDVIGAENGASYRQRLDHGEPVAGGLGHRVGHQGDGLRNVHPEPPGAAGPGQRCSQIEQQAVGLGGRQVHGQPCGSIETTGNVGDTGCCWVMQWMPPPRSKIGRASTSTTSRSG